MDRAVVEELVRTVRIVASPYRYNPECTCTECKDFRALRKAIAAAERELGKDQQEKL